jgi:hypothetical protein
MDDAVRAVNGFTSNSSMPDLDWHYNLGFTLEIHGLLVIDLGALTRRPWSPRSRNGEIPSPAERDVPGRRRARKDVR